ncbi:MAG: hypothetical protein ABW098_08380 [Candidatus Thiodiazotropha sp.]
MNGIREKAFLALILCQLHGCSALITASATDEEDIIWIGASKEDIRSTLGDPIESEEFPEPQELKSVENNRPTLIVTSNSVHITRTSYAIEKGYYKYKGNIQGKHDVGELVSGNLMTLGVLEIFALPMTVSDRLSEHDYLIEVWFDSKDNVSGYRKTRKVGSENDKQ